MSRLCLPIHEATRFVLVGPHYPENVGAAARALKTMGFHRLVLVRPGRLASPDHEMARKMAVKSSDVLEAARVVESLGEAIGGVGLVLGTTSRRGISGVLGPREAAPLVERAAARGGSVAVVLGNEKTGLGQDDLALCHERVRIPMVADQPSVNLAQAVQIIAYELLLAGLDAKG
jgi:tRNA (cytidine32/uridine32-2'-O)-methyltransferase